MNNYHLKEMTSDNRSESINPDFYSARFIRDVNHDLKSSHTPAIHHRARQQLYGIINVLLICVTVLWSTSVDCHKMIDASTNTGTGLPTTMVTGVETESRQITYSGGHMVFGYLCAEGTPGTTVANCIKLFSQSGALLASSSARTFTTVAQKVAFQLKDPMKVIYAVVNHIVVELTLSYSAPNYALSETQAVNWVAYNYYFTLSYSDPASVDNYVYIADLNLNYKIFKFDRNNFGALAGSAYVSTMQFDRILERVRPGSPYLVNGGKAMYLVFIDTTTMSTASTPLSRYIGVELRLGRVENTATNNYMYCVLRDATIYKYELIASFPTIAYSATYHILDTAESKGFSIQLVDLSTYQYLVLTRESNSSILFLKRSDLSLVSIVNHHDSLATAFSSMQGPYFNTTDNQYYFTRLENTNKNFQSYYLLFDNCTYRGSNDVCTTCLTGYYKNTTSAGGDCILPAHFLPSHGINAPSILMSPCSTGCISCLLNYQICVQCDLPIGYYLNTSSSLCYQKTAFGDGRGAMLVNASAGQVVGCQDANCISCIDNYQTCLQCNLGTGYYLNPVDSKCYNKAQFVPGNGVQAVNASAALVSPCTSTGCVSCADNYGTCLQCNLGTGYYLNPVDSKCYNKAQFVPGNGVQAVNASAALVSPCTSTGCVSCVDNYGTCLQCNLGTSYYLNSTDRNCYTKPAFGAGRGAKAINATAAEVSACSSTGCISCTDNYQTCLQCNSGSNYYLNTATSACVTYPAMTSGTGANLVTGAVSPCTVSHCTDCTTDYTACSACDTGSQYYHYSANNICLNQSTIPPRFGPNTGTGSVESCTDANCLNCTATKATCRTCDSAASYYQYSGNCIQPAAFPPQYGVHTATLEVRPCVDTMCGVCLTDNLVCTTCLVASGSYLYIAACILPADSPSGYGADLFSMLIDTCQVANCTSCQNDRSTCQGCDINAGAVLANGSCTAISSLPAGYGVKTSDGTAQPCTDSQCPDCRNNYLVCSQCVAGMYSLNGNCVKKSSIQSGYGIDTATNKVLLCSDEHCKGCLDDFQTCTECDQANGYTPDAGKCVQSLEKLKLKKTRYNTIDQISEVTFESRIRPVSIADLSIYVVDDTSGLSHACGNDNCTLSIRERMLLVTLKFEFEITKGVLHIEKGSGIIESFGNKKVFEDYPIKVINVFHMDVSKGYSNVMKTTSKTAETAKALLNIIGMSISPAASIMLDKMLANFMYLELLTGPFLVYPDYVFKAARGLNMIPFRMGNPFEKWGQQTSCVPLESFVIAEYECGFFANYGEDFFGLIITLAINIVISLSCILAILIILDRRAAKGFEPLSSQRSIADRSGPAKKSTDWIEVYTWIGDNYGVKFFFIHTRSEAIKILCFSVLNLFATQDSSFIAVGTGFSVYWLAFYAVKVIFLTSIINTVWGRHKEQNPAIPSAADLVVKKRVKIEHSYLWFLDFYFEEMHLGKMRWSLFLPVVEVARCIVISLVVYLVASIPVAQHSIAGVVEIAYMTFLLKSNVKIKIAETVFECFVGVMHITYIIMRSLSTREMDEHTRQTKYGMPMAGILIAMIAVELMIAIIILLYLIFLLGKWMRKSLIKKSKKRSRVSNSTPTTISPVNRNSTQNPSALSGLTNLQTLNGQSIRIDSSLAAAQTPAKLNRLNEGETRGSSIFLNSDGSPVKRSADKICKISQFKKKYTYNKPSLDEPIEHDHSGDDSQRDKSGSKSRARELPEQFGFKVIKTPRKNADNEFNSPVSPSKLRNLKHTYNKHGSPRKIPKRPRFNKDTPEEGKIEHELSKHL